MARDSKRRKWRIGLTWPVLALFIVTRAWILCDPETLHSTIRLYAAYGLAKVRAEREGKTVYRVRAEDIAAAKARGERLEPGSGTIEYPPLVISWMAAPFRQLAANRRVEEGPTLVSAGVERLRASLASCDVIGLLLLLFVLRKGIGAISTRTATAVLTYTITGVCLYAVIYDRMDIAVGVLLLASLAASLSRAPWYVAIMLLAVAINFKVIGVFLIAPCIVGAVPCSVFRQPWRRQIAPVAGRIISLILMTAAILAPYVYSGGRASLEFLLYHARRGMQLESFGANLVLLLGRIGIPLTIEHSYGSTNVTAPGARLIIIASSLTMVTLLVWGTYRFWRTVVARCCSEARPGRVAQEYPQLVIRSSVLFLAIGVCCSKVFSPQYMLWFVPLMPAIELEEWHTGSKLQTWFGIACACTMLMYPILFDTDVRPSVRDVWGFPKLLPPTVPGLFVMTVRNAAMLCVTVGLWRSLSERGALPGKISTDQSGDLAPDLPDGAF